MIRLAHTLRRKAAHWGRAGLGLVFPPRCAYCQSDSLPNDRLMLCPD